LPATLRGTLFPSGRDLLPSHLDLLIHVDSCLRLLDLLPRDRGLLQTLQVLIDERASTTEGQESDMLYESVFRRLLGHLALLGMALRLFNRLTIVASRWKLDLD